MPKSLPAETPGAAPPDQPPGRAQWRASVLIIIVAILVGAAGISVLGPRASVTNASSGDRALAAEVRGVIGDGDGLQSLSVARVDRGRVTFAGVGDAGAGAPTPDTVYELGSVTKVWTGLLLADAVERGEMTLDAPIETYLPELRGTPAGATTPRRLATHTSGLPSLPEGAGLAEAWQVKRGGDVYRTWDAGRVLAAARRTPTNETGRVYSNLGVALLGHAEARAASSPTWQALVRDRILDPVGMSHTTFAGADPAGMAEPHRGSGSVSSTWSGDGFAPAGTSTRTTAADMARFLQAVLDGRVIGLTALDPIAEVNGNRRQGLLWLLETDEPAPTHWHNGATGGSSSMLALDRSAQRGVVVLGNSDVAVEAVGFKLLHADSRSTQRPIPWDWNLLAPLLVGGILVLTLWWYAVRGRDRLSLSTGVVDGVLAAILVWVWGPWHAGLGYLNGVVIAAALLGIVLSLLRFRAVPWSVGRRVTAATSLAFTILCLGVVVLALAR